MLLTLKVALRPQIADGQPQYAEAIELAEDVLLEGQQRGEQIQFGVEALAMPLGGVALRDAAVLRRRFEAASKEAMV